MLRDELAEIFQPEFFPATSCEIAFHLGQQDNISSDIIDLVNGLENDPNFKYNSIDDILPMPSLTDYPFYVKGHGSYYKILSKRSAVSVDPKYSNFGAPCVNYTDVEGNVQRWHKFERSTKEEFITAYHEAQKNLRSLIFNDIKQKVE